MPVKHALQTGVVSWSSVVRVWVRYGREMLVECQEYFFVPILVKPEHTAEASCSCLRLSWPVLPVHYLTIYYPPPPPLHVGAQSEYCSSAVECKWSLSRSWAKPRTRPSTAAGLQAWCKPTPSNVPLSLKYHAKRKIERIYRMEIKGSAVECRRTHPWNTRNTRTAWWRRKS